MSCGPVTGLSQNLGKCGERGKSGRIWENKRQYGKENDNVGKYGNILGNENNVGIFRDMKLSANRLWEHTLRS